MYESCVHISSIRKPSLLNSLMVQSQKMTKTRPASFSGAGEA
jgi:hypothetical protein